jgi:hypothetical protein
MTQLQTVVANSGSITQINEIVRSLSPAGLYGINPATTSGLTLGYYGGQFNSVTVSDGTIALTASNTNYVVAHRTTGAVTAATNTTNWSNTGTYLQLYEFVAGAASFTIAATSDKRQAFGASTAASFGGGTLTSALNEAPQATISSAASVAIGAATANTINVTGTTTITAFDSIAAGAKRLVVFSGILTLTHNATSLILPTGASITTAAGDAAEFISLGSGNWRCVNYMRASGNALAGSAFSGGTLTTALNEAPQVALASAATVNIGAAAANTVTVSGTTTITAFDSIATGAIRRVRFLAALTLTHNGTSLILPGSASISTAAGDVAFMESLGSGNWRCITYFKADGTAVVGGGGGGLTGSTSAISTTSPNNTVNASSITASGGTTNQDMVLAAKGTGATLAQIPDGTATGGNKRGARAVDWQKSRGAAAGVASGADSTIGGGADNQAAGTSSTVAGGSSNTVSNQFGFIGGGTGNSVTADYGHILGGTSNTVSGDYATNVGGIGCQATGNRSRVGGAYGTTRGIHMADVFGTSSTLGKHQRENFGLQANTTDATPTVTFAFTGTASTSNQVTLQNNSSMTFSALVSAKRSGSTDTAHFKIEGGAVRGANAAATSIVGTPVVTALAAAAGASGWTVAVTANTTLGCLTFTVTGAAATTIEWDVQVLASAVVLA